MCYVTCTKQHFRLHYHETLLILFYSRLSLRTIDGDRLDDTAVNFGFETFETTPIVEDYLIQVTLMREAVSIMIIIAIISP